MPTPEALEVAIKRIERLRFRLVRTAPPQGGDDGSLVEILDRSAEVCALDTALATLRAALMEIRPETLPEGAP